MRFQDRGAPHDGHLAPRYADCSVVRRRTRTSDSADPRHSQTNSAVATFFVVGSHVRGSEDVLRRMIGIGCEVGNHTFSHPSLNELTEEQIEYELRRTSEIIELATSKRPDLMRPPFGRDALRAADVGRQLGMTTAMYTVSVHDWDGKASKEIARRVLDGVQRDGIVLLHDAGPDGTDRGPTVEALAIILPALRADGYKLLTVGDLLRQAARAARTDLIVGAWCAWRSRRCVGGWPGDRRGPCGQHHRSRSGTLFRRSGNCSTRSSAKRCRATRGRR